MPTTDVSPARLGQAVLARLPAGVAVPRYDRAAVGRAIVHVSVGAFHRAHQALYLDDLLHRGGDRAWGVCGVGLLPQDRAMADALRPQDLLYTLVERDAGVENVRVVGSLRDYLHAPSGPDAVLERLADPETRIVTLTVTESGYYRDEATGELRTEHPNIRRDLERRDGPPLSVYGFLEAALRRRRAARVAPFTVLSCDNVQRNGEVARRMFTAFAGLRDPGLGRWIEEHVAFPSSMVDRITPATNDALRAHVRGLLGGVVDAWPVAAEPFRQWVVEDRFGNGRPALEDVGVTMARDVHPYEMMKIRLLNGGHQALCHVGLLLGHRTSDAAMRDPQVRAFCARYMDVVRPLVDEPPGVDLERYRDTLLHRFANPEIGDRLVRIASDASSRIPGFVLPSAREQRALGRPIGVFALVVAAWIRGLRGTDECGAPLEVPDPMRDALLARARAGDPTDPSPLLGLRDVFGAFGDDPVFSGAVRDALLGLYRDGCRATLARREDPAHER